MADLTCEILEISIDEENYENHKVKFSCYDDETYGVVSFVAEINQAHAAFLYEHASINLSTAYGQMIRFMCEQGLEEMTVGQEFVS